LLAVGIAAQRVLTAEARADRPLLVGIVKRHLRAEEVAQGQAQPGDQLVEQERLGTAVDDAHGYGPQCIRGCTQPKATSPPAVSTSQNRENGRNTFQPSRIS